MYVNRRVNFVWNISSICAILLFIDLDTMGTDKAVFRRPECTVFSVIVQQFSAADVPSPRQWWVTYTPPPNSVHPTLWWAISVHVCLCVTACVVDWWCSSAVCLSQVLAIESWPMSTHIHLNSFPQHCATDRPPTWLTILTTAGLFSLFFILEFVLSAHFLGVCASG